MSGVDLVGYLPEYLKENKDISITLDAENPEFNITWCSTEKVLKNGFIETAEEYGIARFEKFLSILPAKEDSLEFRRARVQVRWFNTLPYTLRVFLRQLTTLCGENNFTVTRHYKHYELRIETNLEHPGEVEEVQKLIDEMIPCNMVVNFNNEIFGEATGYSYIAVAPTVTQYYEIYSK